MVNLVSYTDLVKRKSKHPVGFLLAFPEFFIDELAWPFPGEGEMVVQI